MSAADERPSLAEVVARSRARSDTDPEWRGRYDDPERAVLARMKGVLMSAHGWDLADFEGMTFADVESEFLDVEPDFR